MARHVFDNSQVAHIWAQQTQSEGRSHNGNFSFRDTTIYSYHTAIARFVADVHGTRVCLITNQTYSVTTSGKHMPAVRRAVSGRVFYVDSLGGSWDGVWPLVHAKNFEYMLRSIADGVPKLARYHARIYDRLAAEWGMADTFDKREVLLRDDFRKAIEYAEAFGVAYDPTWIEPHVETLRAAWVKWNDPKKVAKREKNRVERERKERLAAELRAIVQAKKDAEYRLAFQSGEKYFGSFRDAEGFAMLRVVNFDADAIPWSERNEAYLETSLGAKVPLDHAVKAFKFIKLVKERGQAWECNGHSIHVGHFTVTSIDVNGNIIAGCHKIAWTEIERVAREIGVFDASPAADALVVSQ